MNKIIGIDIDGVITREGNEKNNIWHNAICEYFGEDIERKKDVFNFIEAYQLTEKEVKRFIEENIENIYRNVEPAKGVKKTLNYLKKLDFVIFLITARDKKFRTLTLNWMKKYAIPFDSLIHEGNKAPLASEKNIELFIEDNKENAIQLLENDIAVIIKDRYHNRNIDKNYENIFRAKNWKEIKNHILDYYDINKKMRNIFPG